jgi:hypothetical protein
VTFERVIALLITVSLFLIIFKYTRTDIKLCFLKHVYYPQIYKYLKGSEKIIRFNIIMIVAFLMGNILYITIRVKNIPGLTRRSGLISIIILISLSLRSNINLVVNYCGIRLDDYARIHRWLERVAIV